MVLTDNSDVALPVLAATLPLDLCPEMEAKRTREAVELKDFDMNLDKLTTLSARWGHHPARCPYIVWKDDPPKVRGAKVLTYGSKMGIQVGTA